MTETKNVSNIHLLIIDDDPENLAEERKWLNRFGYAHISSAQSAKETQEKLEQGHYDIIVADMRMETNNSGFVVVEEVKKRNLSSPMANIGTKPPKPPTTYPSKQQASPPPYTTKPHPKNTSTSYANTEG